MSEFQSVPYSFSLPSFFASSSSLSSPQGQLCAVKSAHERCLRCLLMAVEVRPHRRRARADECTPARSPTLAFGGVLLCQDPGGVTRRGPCCGRVPRQDPALPTQARTQTLRLRSSMSLPPRWWKLGRGRFRDLSPRQPPPTLQPRSPMTSVRPHDLAMLTVAACGDLSYRFRRPFFIW